MSARCGSARCARLSRSPALAGYTSLCFRWFDFVRVDNTLVNVVWPTSVLFVEAILAVLTFVSLVTYTRAYMPYLKRALERKENL